MPSSTGSPPVSRGAWELAGSGIPIHTQAALVWGEWDFISRLIHLPQHLDDLNKKVISGLILALPGHGSGLDTWLAL